MSLRRLRDGNERFASGHSRARYSSAELAAAAGPQRPLAAIVACSDARVPVEAVLDAAPGELFVVRTAGHVLAEASLASIRFAVEVLGVPVVVVLGHADCGAVRAALAGEAPAWLDPITTHIDLRDATRGRTAMDDADPLAVAVEAHARTTARALAAWLAQAGLAVPVVPATYDLASRTVRWFE